MAIRPTEVVLTVADDGIGAFESVQKARALSSLVEAAAELTKGKVTSMPSHHTGEGIFFTSKAAARFALAANHLQLVVDAPRDDIAVLEDGFAQGTRVEVRIARPPRRTLQEVFEAYTENFVFTKTRTVVKLFGLGRDFVSRSEARRLLHGLDDIGITLRQTEAIDAFERAGGADRGPATTTL